MNAVKLFFFLIVYRIMQRILFQILKTIRGVSQSTKTYYFWNNESQA